LSNIIVPSGIFWSMSGARLLGLNRLAQTGMRLLY
jgi:hypothetical protein